MNECLNVPISKMFPLIPNNSVYIHSLNISNPKDYNSFLLESFKKVLLFSNLKSNKSTTRNDSFQPDFLFLSSAASMDFGFLERISYSNLEKITEYIAENPEIVNVVISGCNWVVQHFYETNKIVFEMQKTLEKDTDYLVLYVIFKNYDEKSLEIIDQINQRLCKNFINKNYWFMISSRYE